MTSISKPSLALALPMFLALTASTSPLAQSAKSKLWSEPQPAAQKVPIPSLAPLGEKLMPTVVSIVITQDIDPQTLDPMFKFFKDFFGDGMPESFENKGVGSGLIINEAGYILTNHHVVHEATSIVVSLHGGQEYEAQVVGTDEDTDIALIKIDAENLPTAPLGDSDDMSVGDWVIAIGNPFGLSASITAGIVSAKGRHEVGPGKDHKYQDFLQTDAPINPGSSGGPLFDLSGNAIGINTAINAAGQGIGFAIPINMVKPLIPQLLQHGKVHRSWLGVSVQEVTDAMVQVFALKSDSAGALVADVVKNSPADEAGIEPGDIILTFDGEQIDGVDELSWLASTAGTGEQIEISLWREAKLTTINVNLASMPGEEPESPVAPPAKKGNIASKSDLGLALSSVDPDTAKRFDIAPVDGQYPGVLVTWIKPDSPLEGVETGDVILSIGNKPVTTPKKTLKKLKKAKKGSVLLLYTVSDSGGHFVTYTP